MPDVVIVRAHEIRFWFGEQLKRLGRGRKGLTQVELGKFLGGISGSTISRNSFRLAEREPLTDLVMNEGRRVLAAQKLDAMARWHLAELEKIQEEAMARVVAERKARADRIEGERRAEVERVESQRRAIKELQEGIWDEWHALDVARPSWMQAARLPLMPTAEDVTWFADALRLETRMMGEEGMGLDRSLLDWSQTWRDDLATMRSTLDLLTARAKRRRQAVKTGRVALGIGQLVLWLGFMGLLAAVAYFLYKAITSIPTVVAVLGPVAVWAVRHLVEASGNAVNAAFTSIASVLVLLALTAILFLCVPTRARGQPESPWYPRVLGAALLSLVLLIITAVSWLASGGLTDLR